MSAKSLEITQRRLGLKILGNSFELLPNALIVHGRPAEEEYDEAFQRLSLIESAQSWWWGDLANGRERHYGSLKEMATRLGINYKSLETYQYVAHAYELPMRIGSLTFYHHQIAAPYENRLELLKEAKEKGWSARTLELEIHKRNRAQLTLPPGVFDVIYADPPWQYSNVLPQWGAAEIHYDTMSIQELSSYIDDNGTRIQDKFADNSVLFLWVTNPFLRDAFQVIDAWDFQYKTNIVWVKDKLKKPGSGFWIRGRHELLFICSKGSFLPDQAGKHPIGSVIEEPIVLNDPVQEHSKKPESVYELIEYLYPDGRYLELFARKRREGWTGWGNEIAK